MAGKTKFPKGLNSLAPEYGAWKNMFDRCYNPANPWWSRYGGRGIRVCPRWFDRETGFAAFYHDLGPRPSKCHSLDRIDNGGHYEPGNCRWATVKQQNANKIRSGKNGPTMVYKGRTLREHAAEIGIGYDAFKIRYRKFRRGEITETMLFEAPAVGRARGLANRKRR